MSEKENMIDLVTKLSNKKRNDFFYDKTDTMSIASIQSSIFDLESSMTSCDFEDLPRDPPIHDIRKKYILPFKTKPLNSKNKKPENWLYSSPINSTIHEKPENPIEWMRTIFDDSDYMLSTYKSNLKQKLSKSHCNLYNSVDFDKPEHVETTAPNLISHKSVSDLKNLSFMNEDLYDSRENMTLSKTAPGSTENIVDTRSSFQEFIALAKQQEENLKAEVMRRKLELTKARTSNISMNVPSMKYIKHGHLATTRNRFGYNAEKKIDEKKPNFVSTRYTKVGMNNDTNKDSNLIPSRFLPQSSDNVKKTPQRFRYNISQSKTRPPENKKPANVYHI